MIHANTLLRTTTVALAVTVCATTAGAQDVVWDWGGEKKVASSGRQTVRMSAAKNPGDIIVSFGDRHLYFVTKPGEAVRYPIAVPREQSRWQGMIAVTSKRENPSWTPTPSMKAENPKLPSWVPGGHPLNPLGIRALYLGASAYRIHGTDAPWTIGSAVSKGCVRMYNQDVLDLYPRVKVGANVKVTWDKFDATADADGKMAEGIDNGEKKSVRGASNATSAERSRNLDTATVRQLPDEPAAKKGPATGAVEAAPTRKSKPTPPASPAKKPTPPDEPLWI